MSGRQPREFSIDLVATEPHELQAVGRFIGFMDTPLALVELSIDGGTPLLRGGGGSVLLEVPYRSARLTSPVTQTVRVQVAESPQDVSNIISSGGAPTVNVTVAETPGATVATPAAVTVGDGTAETIAANAARRRITICAHPDNAGPVYIQAVGAGAERGIPLAAGTFAEIRNVAALDVRNDTGLDAVFTTFEEE